MKIYVRKLAAKKYAIKINGSYMSDFVDGGWQTRIYETESEAIRAEEKYRRFHGLKSRYEDEDIN